MPSASGLSSAAAGGDTYLNPFFSIESEKYGFSLKCWYAKFQQVGGSAHQTDIRIRWWMLWTPGSLWQPKDPRGKSVRVDQYCVVRGLQTSHGSRVLQARTRGSTWRRCVSSRKQVLKSAGHGVLSEKDYIEISRSTSKVVLTQEELNPCNIFLNGLQLLSVFVAEVDVHKWFFYICPRGTSFCACEDHG